MNAAGPCWVAGLVIDDAGRVLLVTRSERAWDLPSGALNRGEPTAVAVRRVVADQATIGVSVGHLLGVHDGVHDRPTLVFTAKHVRGRATAAGGVRRCLWVPLRTAAGLMGGTRAAQLAGIWTSVDTRCTS